MSAKRSVRKLRTQQGNEVATSTSRKADIAGTAYASTSDKMNNKRRRSGTVRKTWHVEGMHCPHCETAVRRALSGAQGISDIEVSYEKGTLSAMWDASLLPEAAIDSRLRDAGYSLVQGSALPFWAQSLLRLLIMLALAFVLYLLLTRTPVARWTQAFPMAKEGMGLGMLFIVGLATSLHCVAMCGGINLAQSATSAQHGVKPSVSNLLYNLGRLTSYSLIGGIIGGLGQVFSISNGMKAAIQLFAAAFMLIMALNLVGCFSWLRKLVPHVPDGLGSKIMGKLAGKSSYIIGLANGLMPCGPLQAMQLYALSSGSALRGALSMFCFCLGTIPLMLGMGFVTGKLNRRFAKPMRYVSALLVLVMGVSALASGMALTGTGVPAAKPTGENGVAEIQDGVQYLRSELEFGGYPVITVAAGVPVEWTLHADETKINNCNHEIYIPAFDLSVPLQPGDNLIRFTPEEEGDIPYTCWMGMIRSTIHVTEGET